MHHHHHHHDAILALLETDQEEQKSTLNFEVKYPSGGQGPILRNAICWWI